MADKLEIIHKSGDIRFYALDADKGVTNIGRHPDNDVVLDSPTVDAFHAVLDHRQKPYQLMLLSAWGNPRIGGHSVSSQSTLTIMPWDTVEIDGYSLMVVEGNTSGPSRVTSNFTSTPTRPSAAVSNFVAPIPTAPESTAPRTGSTPSSRFAQQRHAASHQPTSPAPETAVQTDTGENLERLPNLPADQVDEVIMVAFQAGEFALDVEKRAALDFGVEVKQTATFDAIITNGGDLVATFRLEVLGLPSSWVTVDPPEINLNEGNQAAVRVTITPPRAPTVWAGVHYFAVAITSNNYPGRRHVTNGGLQVKPFQEFTLGDLSPKEQSVSFTKRVGHFTIPVVNKGNGDEVFHISAEDNEHGCQFEFDTPDEVPQSRALETSIPANTSVDITGRIIPLKRQFIGFSGRTYNYTVTVGAPQSQQAPRSLLGQVKTSPFIGPIPIILFVLLVVGLIIWFSMPGVKVFTATGPDPELVVDAPSGNTLFINAGEIVTFNWEAAPFFTDLRLVNQDTKEVISEIGQSDEPRGRVVLSPTVNTKYQLEATTWLSKIYPGFTAMAVIPVSVAPVKPRWISYTGGKLNILRGQNVVYTWKVEYAEAVFLVTRVNNVETRTPVPAEQVAQGSLTLTPNDNTIYYLTAHNRYTSEQGEITPEQLDVTVLDPTSTPLPAPVIVRFDVQPEVITAGESIKVEWAVNGVVAGITQVLINGEEQAPNGSLEFFPTENTVYTIVAINGDQQDTKSKTVRVNPAPPPAQAPKIEFFTATPNQVVLGSAEANSVKLNWSISGNVTQIKLISPDLGELIMTDKVGSFTVAVTKLTQFVLTAYNGELNASANVQVQVIPPTATPTPSPTPFPAAALTITLSAENAPADRVEYAGANGNTHTYRVVQGTNVRISWTGTNTSKVVFDGVEYGGPAGSVVRLITTARQFSLQAHNAQGTAITPIYINVEVIPRTPPPAPFNVNGPSPSGSAPLTITWSYDTNSLPDIVRFRIYRSIPPGNPAIAAEVASTPPHQWVDTSGGCGMGYYVVGLYYDIDGATLLETPPSTNSWYSQPCPIAYSSNRLRNRQGR